MLTPVSRPCEEWSLKIGTIPRYFDVSVNIAIYTLFNNIVSDTIHSVVVCVDFLDTHMANLVLFLKLGMTSMLVVNIGVKECGSQMKKLLSLGDEPNCLAHVSKEK